MARTRNTLLRFCFSAGILALSLGSSAGTETDTVSIQPVRNEWLRAAKELARRVQATAADEEVPRLFTSDDEVLAYIHTIGTADYSKLQQVTVAEIPRSKLAASFLMPKLDTSIDTATYRRIDQIMKTRLNPAHLISILNSQEGTTGLLAGTILSESRTYIQPRDWTEDLLLVLDYGGEDTIAVAFWKSGEKTVTGQATFIVSGSADKLFEALDGLCGEHLPVRKLTGADLNEASL